ncbi:Rv3654c family TadE-like protein [Glutamicibacter sp.]|uniref:Rv3654c family TadE-like protein n=1 Tax=Glutamicibacter sp. TaxID=1931995 RepID=UPI0028BDD497|nr:Rv3654c family TadE-like protein [Glutamicibacter sp.]
MKISSLSGAQRGSSTVAVAGIVATVLLLAAAVLGFSAAGRATMQAGTAADLAALAAADTARGLRSGDPCGTAAQVAGANHAELSSCRIEADGTTVRVAVDVRLNFSAAGITLYRAHAQARAGAPPLNAD